MGSLFSIVVMEKICFFYEILLNFYLLLLLLFNLLLFRYELVFYVLY